jgi:hypothetical protein
MKTLAGWVGTALAQTVRPIALGLTKMIAGVWLALVGPLVSVK